MRWNYPDKIDNNKCIDCWFKAKSICSLCKLPICKHHTGRCDICKSIICLECIVSVGGDVRICQICIGHKSPFRMYSEEIKGPIIDAIDLYKETDGYGLKFREFLKRLGFIK